MAAPAAAHNCPVCLEDYVPRRKPRIFVECGHDACTQCIVDMAAHGRDRCPTCTKPVRMAADLPVIWRIIGDGPASKEAEEFRPAPRAARLPWAWPDADADEVAPWDRPLDMRIFAEAPHMGVFFCIIAGLLVLMSLVNRVMHHLKHLVCLTPIVLLIVCMGWNAFVILYNAFVSVYNGGVVAVGIARAAFV